MRFCIRFIILTLAIVCISQIVPGIMLDSVFTACVVAFMLGLLNTLIRPVLVLITLPITLLTFGLFLFVINALLLYFVGSVIDGFTINGFAPALLGSIGISFISWLTHKLI